MKKKLTVTLLSVSFIGAPALASDIGGMKMNQHADMAQATPTHKATGVVKAIDLTKGKITLAHGPVSSISWPAMTMAFHIDQDLADGIQTGQRVEFEFTVHGMKATVTKITASN